MNIARELKVSSVGFSPSEDHLIGVFLGLSKAKSMQYVLTDADNDADIIIFNTDSGINQGEFKKYSSPGTPIISVSKRASKENTFQVIKPISPTRLIEILEEVTLKELSVEEPKKKETEENLKVAEADGEENVSFSSEIATKVKRRKQVKKNSIFDHDYNVLIVDDNKTIREAVGAKVHALNINTTTVSTGEQAIDLCFSQKKKFDLIFLDIELPAINGYAVCKELKGSLYTRDTPICMLTGKESQVNKIKGRMSGCDEYVTKNATLTELLEVMCKYMPKLSKKK